MRIRRVEIPSGHNPPRYLLDHLLSRQLVRHDRGLGTALPFSGKWTGKTVTSPRYGTFRAKLVSLIAFAPFFEVQSLPDIIHSVLGKDVLPTCRETT